MHAAFLVLHAVSGSLGLVIGPLGMRAPKRRGRHTRLGHAYLAAVTGVAVTAVALAAFDWSRLWWLAVIGLLTEAAALGGLAVRRRGFAGWRPWHVSFMCGSYISLVTALLVVNFGSPVAWLLPTVVGSPLIAWTALRAASTADGEHARVPSGPPWRTNRNSRSRSN